MWLKLVGVPSLLSLLHQGRSGTLFFILLLAFGLCLRMQLLHYGTFGDMGAWGYMAGLYHNDNIYLSWPGYVYGPLWYYIVHWLDVAAAVVLRGHPLGLQAMIILFLSGIDLLIAWLLRRRYGLAAALIYYFCPITILVSGYYGQFHNIAILFGLMAWLLLQPKEGEPGWGSVFGVALLLGLSLMAKHILVFLPLWFLFENRLGILQRLALATLPYALFIGSFVPFVDTPFALQNIRTHVFGFQMQGLRAFLPQLIDLFVPLPILQAIYAKLQWLPVFNGVKLVWALLMLLVGWLAMRKRPEYGFFFYLVAMIGLTPLITIIYVVIPVAACVAFRRSWLFWMYLIIASLLLLTNFSQAAVPTPGWLVPLKMTAAWLVGDPDMTKAQIWLCLLLLASLWPIKWQKPDFFCVTFFAKRKRATAP